MLPRVYAQKGVHAMESTYTQQQMRSDRMARSRLPSGQVDALWVSLSLFPVKILGGERKVHPLNPC